MRGLQFVVVTGHRGKGHGQFVGVGTDGFEVVLIGQVGIRSAAEGAAEDIAHGLDDVFLPEKTVAAAGSEIAETQTRGAAEALHFFPEFCFGTRIEDV